MANVHIGNVAEFNLGRPLPASLHEDFLSDRLAGGDEYSSMAPFYTEDPGLVLIPRAEQSELDKWAEVQSKMMGWSSFNPIAWTGDSTALSAHLLDDARVMAAAAAGHTVVPWGETANFRTFVQRSAAKAGVSMNPAIAEWAETKLHQLELFTTSFVDAGRPAGIELGQQTVVGNDDELVAALLEHGRAGRPVVLKTPRGFGGLGSVVLHPHQTASATRCKLAIRLARDQDGLLMTEPLIVERFYWKKAHSGDLSCDFEIDDSGQIHSRGNVVMLLDGNHYMGAVTIDHPSHTVALAQRFGAAVGERLAEGGYRGWFDVDYLRTPKDVLVPLEVNARRTGPSIALHVQSSLNARRGASVSIAQHDGLPLPTRMPAAEVIELLLSAAGALGLAEDVVPTLTTATAAPTPYLGVAVAGCSSDDARARLGALRDALLA